MSDIAGMPVLALILFAPWFLILSVIFVVSAIIPAFLKRPGTFADPLPDAH